MDFVLKNDFLIYSVSIAVGLNILKPASMFNADGTSRGLSITSNTQHTTYLPWWLASALGGYGLSKLFPISSIGIPFFGF